MQKYIVCIECADSGYCRGWAVVDDFNDWKRQVSASLPDGSHYKQFSDLYNLVGIPLVQDVAARKVSLDENVVRVPLSAVLPSQAEIVDEAK